MAGETVMIPDDLPEDLPTFMAQLGTDQQCRDYLFAARWPEGFRCVACGHDDAYALKTKIVYECVACGKQHSLLAGTIFEQTKTGLSRWFLAIYLVTSSKRGISAMELKRQMGFASYGTAWTWLHKIRKAMVRPGRKPLSDRVEADETYVGGARPGRPGRGAAGKTLVAGAVETGRGKARGRRLGRLRLAKLPDASATSLEGFLAANVARPAAVATDGWRGYLGLPANGYGHEPVNLSASWGDAALRLPGHPPRVRPRQALAHGHPSWGGQREASAGLSRQVRLPLQPSHRQAHQPRLRPPHRAGGADQAQHLPRHRHYPSPTVVDRQFQQIQRA